MDSIWLDYLHCLKALAGELPYEFPEELPKEHEPGFWFAAAKLEMESRTKLSEKLAATIKSERPADFSRLEGWLIRRRIEWASQIGLARVKRHDEPSTSLREILQWGLVTSWETDGCVGLWNHAEREGKPHPANPDGLSPVD